MSNYFISLMIILPFLGAVIQAFLPDRSLSTSADKPLENESGEATASSLSLYTSGVAISASMLSMICGLILVFSMQGQVADLQASEVFPWIGSYAIQYDMAIDGLNAPLVLLISLLFPILIAAEWRRKVGVRGIHGLFLILQSALIGAVCAQDMFLQFFFWTLSAVPFYFLIGIWGSKNRESAATRTVVATSLGSALIFAALILIYYSIDPHTFSLRELAGGKLNGRTFDFLGYAISVPVVAFSLIAGGLALRAPIWPLHGWFITVAEEAPLTVFVALSAASLPVAVYIFERLTYTLFPETLLKFSPAIIAVGALNLLVCALCSVSQRNLRKLLAYICLSQAGLLLLGVGSLSSPGFVGAVYEKLVLGLGLAGFGLFADLLSKRIDTADFLSKEGERTIGGIALQAPAVAVVTGIFVASLFSTPGAGGFVGNALISIGAFSSYPAAVIVSGISALLICYSLFNMYRSVFLGGEVQNAPRVSDLTVRERLYLLPIVAGLILFGLYPKPLIELIRPTAVTVLSTVTGVGAGEKTGERK